jgi:hypothetical protein
MDNTAREMFDNRSMAELMNEQTRLHEDYLHMLVHERAKPGGMTHEIEEMITNGFRKLNRNALGAWDLSDLYIQVAIATNSEPQTSRAIYRIRSLSKPYVRVSQEPVFQTDPLMRQSGINWAVLSEDTNPKAIRILEKNQDKMDWTALSMNTNSDAIRILEKNQDKVHWYYLSRNTHPDAIRILEQNRAKIN